MSVDMHNLCSHNLENIAFYYMRKIEIVLCQGYVDKNGLCMHILYMDVSECLPVTNNFNNNPVLNLRLAYYLIALIFMYCYQ